MPRDKAPEKLRLTIDLDGYKTEVQSIGEITDGLAEYYASLYMHIEVDTPNGPTSYLLPPFEDSSLLLDKPTKLDIEIQDDRIYFATGAVRGGISVKMEEYSSFIKDGLAIIAMSYLCTEYIAQRVNIFNSLTRVFYIPEDAKGLTNKIIEIEKLGSTIMPIHRVEVNGKSFPLGSYLPIFECVSKRSGITVYESVANNACGTIDAGTLSNYLTDRNSINKFTIGMLKRIWSKIDGPDKSELEMLIH